MSLPDIDFNKIRIHRGGQSGSFEELCCQLASDEPIAGRTAFNRKGPSGDGGVECFASLSDGSEVGWQVKYYTNLGSMLKSLKGSLDQALDKHPRMSTFIACFPMDFSDSRREDVNTAAATWKDWKEERIREAAGKGRTIEIDYWDAHAIKNRLTVSNPRSAGRIAFWFDRQLLTSEWLSKKFERTKAILGRRYSPESHIDLPIRRSILAIARDPSLADLLVRMAERITRAVQPLSNDTQSHLPTLQSAQKLRDAISLSVQKYPAIEIVSLRKLASDAISAALDWHREVTDSQFRSLVAALSGAAADAEKELSGEHWDRLSASSLLVLGEGGSGKSHLLADACAHQLAAGRPAIMIPGGSLADDNPWQQIMAFLDIAPHMQVDEFLGALNALGEAGDARLLLSIDALNEKNGQHIWPDRLAAFLHDLVQFPYIGVVLSCRTTYEQAVIPDHMTASVLPRAVHVGFTSEEALDYVRQRGLNLNQAPNPIAELKTPLFLRIVCDAIVSGFVDSRAETPRGLSAMFRLYVDAIAASVDRALTVDRRLKLVPKAISVLAAEMAATGNGYITWSRSNELLESIYKTNDGRGLISHLENEGLLASEIEAENDDLELVRFTFERLSDHAIATLLVGEASHTDPGVFGKKGEISSLKHPYGRLSHMSAPIFWGVREALSTILPERTGVELIDAGAEEERWPSEHDFENSIFTRDPKAITERTWALIDETGGDRLRLEALIAIAAEPGHPQNFDSTNIELSKIAMPQRDALWSVHLASSDQITHYISWAMQDGLQLSPERARLTSLLLTWTLTTSRRIIRDTATKSLVCILSDRPELAIWLWKTFKSVDDLYLVERLLAALYGAALQGAWADEPLDTLASEIFADIFRSGNTVANVLVRDHAKGIVMLANHLGALTETSELYLLDAPGQTDWPLEFVSDETIESYKLTFREGGRYRDDITSSCMDGDFARYRIDHAFSRWSMAKRGSTHLPTTQELRESWLADFLKIATPEMIEAHDEFVKVIAEAERLGRVDTAAQKALVTERARFKATVGENVYEDWRARAEYWRKLAMYQTIGGTSGPAMFNLGWARRWICKRAHDFGWSEELHQEFDRQQGSGRMTHAKERIGKKYQWLAFYELLGRVEDHLEPLPRTFDYGPPIREERNIDPSMLRGHTSDDGWRDFDTTAFWIPTLPALSPRSPPEALAWLDGPADILDGAENIEVTDPETGISWFVLRGFDRWHRQHSSFNVEAWRRIACFVVKKGARKKALALIDSILMTDDHAAPFVDLDMRTYLAEYPWAHEQWQDDWIRSWKPGWRDDAKSVAALPTTAEYSAEQGNYDASISQNLTIHLPAGWLMQGLNARLSDGRSINYVANNEIVFCDPSVKGEGRSAALVRKDRFLALLKQRGLAPIWVISGEKRADSPSGSNGFGGCRSFSSRYIEANGKLHGTGRFEQWEPPSPEQKKLFLGSSAKMKGTRSKKKNVQRSPKFQEPQG